MMKEVNEEQIEQTNDVVNTPNRVDYSCNPQGDKIDGFPDFIEILPDGNYKVIMRKIKQIKNKYDYFIVEDISGRKLKQLQDRAKNSKGETVVEKLQELLIQNAVLYPVMSDTEYDNLKSSEILRLGNAINIIYDVQSFF